MIILFFLLFYFSGSSFAHSLPPLSSKKNPSELISKKDSFETPIKIGIIIDSEPYIIQKDGTVDGYYYAVAEAVMDELELPRTYHLGYVYDLLKDLKEGRLDVIVNLYRTTDRYRSFLFTQDILSLDYQAITRKDSEKTKLRYFNNSFFSIGLPQNSLILKKTIKKLFPNSQIVFFQNNEESAKALYQDSIQVMYYLYSEKIPKINGNDSWAITIPACNIEDIGCAFGLGFENVDLYNRINYALYKLKKENKLNLIKYNYLKTSPEDSYIKQITLFLNNLNLILFLFILLLFVVAIILGFFIFRYHKQSAYFSQVFNQIEFPLFLCDVYANSPIIYCNKGLQKLFGGNVTSFNQMGLSFKDNEIDLLKEKCETVTNTKNKLIQYLKIQRKQKEEGYYLLYITPLLFRKKTLVIVVLEDLTELKNMQEEAQNDNRKRLEFIEHISHEIRTPLNAILGFSSLLSPDMSQQEKEDKLCIIQKENNDLVRIISNILLVSKLELGKLELIYTQIDFVHLIEDTLSNNDEEDWSYKESVSVIFLKYYQSITMTTSESYMRMIINNMLRNALQYTEKGKVELGGICNEDEFIFFVKDTGRGIEKELQPMVFERFTRGDFFDSGIGLNMTINRALIEIFKGKLGLYSRKDEGSLFWFSIPIESSFVFLKYPNIEEQTIYSELGLANRWKGFYYDWDKNDRFVSFNNMKEGGEDET